MTLKKTLAGLALGFGLISSSLEARADPINSVTLNPVTNNANITWLWTTQNLVQATSSGNGSITSNGADPDGYVDHGSNVTFYANANKGYFFDYWGGEDSLDKDDRYNPQLSIVVNKPFTNLKAVFFQLPEFTSIKRERNDIILNIEPTSNTRDYVLLSATNLIEGFWKTNSIFSGTGTNIIYSLNDNSLNMFFKIKIEPKK